MLTRLLGTDWARSHSSEVAADSSEVATPSLTCTFTNFSPRSSGDRASVS
jgi:hypothetical protein